MGRMKRRGDNVTASKGSLGFNLKLALDKDRADINYNRVEMNIRENFPVHFFPLHFNREEGRSITMTPVKKLYSRSDRSLDRILNLARAYFVFNQPIEKALWRYLLDVDFISLKYVDDFYYYKKGFYHPMPRKNDFNYVDKPLTEKQVKECIVWMDTFEEDLALCLTQNMKGDYRLSVAWFDNHGSFRAMITTNNKTDANHNHGLTAWSDDAGEAILMCVYNHAVLYKDKTWSELKTTSRRG